MTSCLKNRCKVKYNEITLTDELGGYWGECDISFINSSEKIKGDCIDVLFSNVKNDEIDPLDTSQIKYNNDSIIASRVYPTNDITLYPIPTTNIINITIYSSWRYFSIRIINKKGDVLVEKTYEKTYGYTPTLELQIKELGLENYELATLFFAFLDDNFTVQTSGHKAISYTRDETIIWEDVCDKLKKAN